MSGRNARVLICSFEIHCPYCGEAVPEPKSGSLYWTVEEVPTNPFRFICANCSKQFSLPRNYWLKNLLTRRDHE